MATTSPDSMKMSSKLRTGLRQYLPAEAGSHSGRKAGSHSAPKAGSHSARKAGSRSGSNAGSRRRVGTRRGALLLLAALLVAATVVETQTSVTLQVNPAPNAGQPGVHTITLTGSGFPAGTIL